MALISYLYGHFYDLPTLVEKSGLSKAAVGRLQTLRIMPQPSYRLLMQSHSDSFFGQHECTEQLAFYPTGSVSWLAKVAELKDEQQAFHIFKTEYLSALSNIATRGCPFSGEHTEAVSLGVEQQWPHFLEGTYGVCTRSGAVEEIAGKNIAVRVIESLIIEPPDKMAEETKSRLKAAVSLLDRVAAPFAPHELAKSSRERLVNQVRRGYSLG